MVNFDVFDAVALVVWLILVAAAFMIIVLIGGLPGRIARIRGHAQPAAVTAAGWIGLATAGLLWPIAFVWAFVKPSSPALAPTGGQEPEPKLGDWHAELRACVASLEAGLRALQDSKGRAA
jgi:hypothetical protein